MTMKEKTILTFEKRTYDSHGYTQTEVVIRTMYQVEIRDKLAGTVENRDGYGTPDAAQWWARACGVLLDEHHKFMYEFGVYGDVSVVLRWQHYGKDDNGDMTYCDVDFENLGRHFPQIENGVKFLLRLGERISGVKGRAMFPTPESVIGALQDMKHKTHPVIEVEHRSFQGSTVGVWVEPHH